ncbi:MAG TPA: O-antigen ligase family protein [Bacteroidia bacterium]|nr:O-antigen ligase family protein [Bacteroidia bacterium]
MRISLPQKYHSVIYFFGLTVLVVGLPLSMFLMSLGQLILFGNWLWEGHLKEKILKFWNNKTAVIIASVFVFHLIGLLYTSDFNYGFEDVRKKVPMFLLPLIISSSEQLSLKKLHQLLHLFIAALIAATFCCMAVFYGYIPTNTPQHVLIDMRDISIFISPIRFALLICIGIFTLAYYIYHENKISRKLFFSLLTTWLIVFMIILESITGLVVLFTVSVILLIYLTWKQHKKIFFVMLLLLPICVFIYSDYMIHQFDKKPPKIIFSTLDKTTTLGNAYYNDTTSTLSENGHYVMTYICWKELDSVWNKRSTIKMDQKDLKGNNIRYTLLRFLASKNYRKDANGVNELTADEIFSIQKGIPNYKYQHFGSLNARVYELLGDINNLESGENPSGHSVSQRIAYWKAAIGIIKKNPLIGVGTGDVKNAFAEEYNREKSPLSIRWRLRSHNQYLAIGVAFGIIGMAWFFFALFYPPWREKKYFNYFFITFFLIAILSMLTEDTLETQAGATFFAFFNAFFLLNDLTFKKEKTTK